MRNERLIARQSSETLLVLAGAVPMSNKSSDLNFKPPVAGEPLFDFEPLILVNELEKCFRDEVIKSPLRQTFRPTDDLELLIMPAIGEIYSGVKVLSVVPPREDSPAITGIFIIFETKCGRIVTTLDATELTARRTAAVSALAADKLARRDASKLLMVGSGHIVPYLAEAHSSVRKLDSIAIWARNADKARRAAAEIQERLPGLNVEVAYDLREAVSQAHVISTATRASAPLLQGEWIACGTHLDLVGGYNESMREVDSDGVSRASIYVDTLEGALAEAGDLIIPLRENAISIQSILGDIGALSAGSGRRSDEEITIFKSVGSAASDLIVARFAWEKRGRPGLVSSAN